MHQASRAVVVLPVADHPTKDDSAPMDVFIVATIVTVRRTTHFASSSLLQCPVGFLAARVVATMVVWFHFRAHRGLPTPTSRALHRHLDHYLNSIHPSFNLSISISTALKRRGTKLTHRITKHLPGVRDPIVIRPQVLGPVPVVQARVVVRVRERPLGKHM